MLIRDEETEYLVLSPASLSKHHATILERFAEQNDIEGKYLKKPFKYVFLDPGWMSWGAENGRSMIRAKFSTCSGSPAYGRFLAEGLIDRIQKIPGMNKYNFKIDSR